MKETESIHYRYIEILYNHKDLEVNQELLELFSIYISSNSAFKYNKTYLTDQISDFQNAVINFYKKKQYTKTIESTLSNEFTSLGDWFIVIDNIFFIGNDIKLELLSTRIDGLNQIPNAQLSESSLNERIYLLAHQKKFNFYQTFHKAKNTVKCHYVNLETSNNYVFNCDLYVKNNDSDKISNFEVPLILRNSFNAKSFSEGNA